MDSLQEVDYLEKVKEMIKVEENKDLHDYGISPGKFWDDNLEIKENNYNYQDAFGSSGTTHKLFDIEDKEIKRDFSNIIPVQNSFEKKHYSDGEIGVLKESFKHQNNPKIIIKFKDLWDQKYTSKCIFWKNTSKPPKNPPSKAISIFDNNLTPSSNPPSLTQIQNLYQDSSLQNLKTAVAQGPPKTAFPCIIKSNLDLKYLTSREYYNTKIINDVVYNENTHVVSVFKDYLIFDDVSEFLKRQYTTKECKKRLPKVIEFYETYSKVFPNYVNIPENRYMFK